MKMRHKKMARCAYRGSWSISEQRHNGRTYWPIAGPFAKWVSQFRSAR